MIRRSAFGGGNVRRPNRWTYFSEGIATVNQSRVRRPLLPMPMGGGVIGTSPTPTLSPARSRRISWTLTVLMTAMVASQNPLPERQSRGAPQEPQTPRTLRTYGTAHTSHTAKASTRAPQRLRDSQPESSATAAKRGAPRVPQTPRTLRTYGTAQTSHTAKASTGTPRLMRNRGGLDGANDTAPDDSESDFVEIFFRNLSVGLVPDSEVISDIPLGKRRSAPLPEAPVLRSGRQIPGPVWDQADRKKAPNSTPINSSSKRDRAAMTGGEDHERPANISQPPRKRVRRNETPATGPNTDSDAGSQPAEVCYGVTNSEG